MSKLTKFGRWMLQTPNVGPEESAYRRLHQKGFSPSHIVDVGAYEGEWTRLAWRVFGKVPATLIEPQLDKAQQLKKISKSTPGTTYVNAVLAGEAGRRVDFFEMETGSSFLEEQSNVPRKTTSVITQTLDICAVSTPPGLFLKIDVQGAEIEVLKGGTVTLSKAGVVQLEVPLLEYNKGAPNMLEILQFMDARGFTPFDFCGFSRPNGVDTVQVDILFVPSVSLLRPKFFAF